MDVCVLGVVCIIWVMTTDTNEKSRTGECLMDLGFLEKVKDRKEKLTIEERPRRENPFGERWCPVISLSQRPMFWVEFTREHKIFSFAHTDSVYCRYDL